MPIHELGYRPWQGTLTVPGMRFRVIGGTGISLAWKNRWLRRLVLVAWLPTVYLGLAFFLLEQALANNVELLSLSHFMGMLPQAELVLEQAAAGSPAAARHDLWAWLLLSFLRYPQGFVMVLAVGMIAPPLIAKDVLTRAYLLYFSRPLARTEYVLGKVLVVCGFMGLIVTAPALLLYVLGVFLSPPDAGVIASTWDLPLRILLASLVLVVPTTSLAIAFSSLTSKAFYARFAWFATWFLGMATYWFLQASLGVSTSEHWSLLSLYHTLGKVQSWVFGLPIAAGRDVQFFDVMPSIALLAGITVVSMVVVFRRVSATTRI